MSEEGDAGGEINFSNVCEDSNEQYFYQVIGCIEDVLMDNKFIELHNSFMDKYWKEFEDSEENKFVYTDIFKEYNETIEKYIQTELVTKIENFDMNRLEAELEKRKYELDGEIFEILSTFTDFLAFKEKFLDYKAMKEGRVTDLSKEFIIYTYKNNTEY